MAIEGFDYKNFAEVLTSQADELLPADFNDFQRKYVANTLRNFSMLAGEALYNESPSAFNADQAMLITQIIAEWSFHKSVDLIKANIAPEHWDGVMQKIAFTIFEIAKQALAQGMPQDQVLQVVENHVHSSYEEALNELKQAGAIDEELYDRAAHQSNIDEMMVQAQQESVQNPQAAMSDSKILKLASVALLLKQVSQDKVQTILNKFSEQDAQSVIQYMQMPDLEQKVDKDIAIKCLQEIRTNLPEPKTINPNKILSKIKKVFNEKGKVVIETTINKERPNVKDFVKNACEGEYTQMPSKVANLIAQHLEESL